MITMKYLISLFISVKIGSIVTNFFAKADINVWIARVIGCIICIMIGLIFYSLWINRKS